LSSNVLLFLPFLSSLLPAKFFSYCQAVDVADAATWQGRDLRALNMWELYREFGLDSQTVDFVGHAIALETSDRYMTRPALPTVAKVKLYYESVVRYEGLTSPYIYPLYGLGELPQAFARLAAVHGGTYMLDRPDVEVTYDEQVRGGLGWWVGGWVGGWG
jgi:Rab GDP dissociation inhibitor